LEVLSFCRLSGAAAVAFTLKFLALLEQKLLYWYKSTNTESTNIEFPEMV
jgi:hypothetical protein